MPGPLLARFGRVTLPPPGGDVIGRRRVDTHFLALEQLGASLRVGDSYQIEAKQLIGAEIFLDEPSVTGTENALMAAVAAKGRTRPPQRRRRAPCAGCGSTPGGHGRADRRHRHERLYHRGRVARSRGTSYDIGPDHIEIASFIGLAAVTNGQLIIDGVRADDLRSTLLGFDRLGVRPRVDGYAADRGCGTGAPGPPRSGRPCAEAGRRAVAGLSRPTPCRSRW